MGERQISLADRAYVGKFIKRKKGQGREENSLWGQEWQKRRERQREKYRE